MTRNITFSPQFGKDDFPKGDFPKLKNSYTYVVEFQHFKTALLYLHSFIYSKFQENAVFK